MGREGDPLSLSSATMEEREREELKTSWGRRGLFIGPLKSNRYVLFWPKRYYRSEFEIHTVLVHVDTKRYYRLRYRSRYRNGLQSLLDPKRYRSGTEAVLP